MWLNTRWFPSSSMHSVDESVQMKLVTPSRLRIIRWYCSSVDGGDFDAQRKLLPASSFFSHAKLPVSAENAPRYR